MKDANPEAAMKPLLLVGNVNSYFSQKMRCYLKWKGVAFRDVTPTTEVYVKLLGKLGVSQIPVLVDDNVEGGQKVVVDTSIMIDYVEANYSGVMGGRKESVHPANGVHRVAGFWLETFADEWMKLPAMHYRWQFEENREFVVADWMLMMEPRGASAKKKESIKRGMGRFQSMCGVLGVTPETGPSINDATNRLFDALAFHFSRHDFLFGSNPTLADFAFAGSLAAHILRDPHCQYQFKLSHPTVNQWVDRLQGLSPPSRGQTEYKIVNGRLEAHHIKNPVDEDFAGSSIPQSLLRVLEIVFSEHVPILDDTYEVLDSVLAKPGNAKLREGLAPLPRILGMRPFKVSGFSGTRGAFPLELWKLQRAARCYNALPQPERTAVRDLALSLPHGSRLVTLMERLPHRPMTMPMGHTTLRMDTSNAAKL